jgi:hypothetical protein
MSGNAIRGSLPNIDSVSKSLEVLYLNDNTLGGDIPKAVQRHEFRKLDLANNKFVGSIDQMANVSKSTYEGKRITCL